MSTWRNRLFWFVTAALLLTTPWSHRAGLQSGAVTRATALVLVNSASPDYADFARYIKPYLDHFGVPYTVANLPVAGVPANLPEYALLIIGHRQIDTAGTFLTPAANNAIAAAVQSGVGLLNFDGALANANVPRYQFAQDVFEFSYVDGVAASTATPQLSPLVGSYVVEAQDANATVTFSRAITPQGVTLAPDAQSLVQLGDQPLLVAKQHGAGRALQWTSYEWMRADTWGYFRGWDDLIWRGIVWAARKPFVMQGLPPLVTMRVDDTTGPYWWTTAAVQNGFKPWLGLFLDDQDASDAAAIRALVQAGNGSASVHARTTSDFFYFNHNFGEGSDWSAGQVAQNFADATAWHQANQIPVSKYVLPHYYEFGTNVFGGLQQWGVEFVGTVVSPGQPYVATTPHLGIGPFNKFETPCLGTCAAPLYYADYLPIPGHPELNGHFFNSVTEVRDDGGYEWYPDSNVAGTASRGVRHLKRALNSMTLASLFTHEYYIHDIAPAEWSQIMSQVASGIAAFQPEHVTIDDGLRYVRAVTTSDIQSSTFNTTNGSLTTHVVGVTDVPTRFYLFNDYAGGIRSDFVTVPIFNGSTDVVFDVSTLPPLPVKIDVWRDEHQSPVLATTADGGALNETDNAWTEFLLPSRGYPGVFASVNETAPLMRFFATVPNGSYHAIAGLYWNGNFRYQWGYSAATATQFSVDVTSGPTSGEFSEYALGQVVVTNGVFELFTRGAQPLPGGSGYPFYGWAWIRLVPTSGSTPAITIDDVVVAEGASGTSSATFTVALSSASTSTVTVPFATSNGSAVAPGDYTSTSGVVTFTPGQTSQPIVVPIVGDSIHEPDETFTVVLSAPTNGILAKSIGVGTIANDDAGPIQIDVWRDENQSPVLATTTDPGALLETDNAWTEFLFPPRGYPGVLASVNETPPLMRFYGTVPNGAYDVVARLYWNGNFRYRWGYSAATPSQFSIDVTSGSVSGEFSDYLLGQVVVTNGVFELFTQGAEALPGGSGYPFYGWAAIRLTPSAGSVPALSINDVSVGEGDSGTTTATFNVTLSSAATQTVSVAYNTSNGTATAPADYTATSGILTFSPGTVSQPVQVAVIGDTAFEPNETFTVTLSAPANATIAKAAGIGTIQNDDAGPIQIDVWRDEHQSPVLATTSDGGALSETDNAWTEFLFPARGYPGVFASVTEAPPLMRFYGSAPNGVYDVVANLYWNGNLRYRWGYSASAPALFATDVTSGPVAGEFAEYPLGQVVVTNGVFELYTSGAEALPGGTGYPFYGWAWIRLIPASPSEPVLSIADTTLLEGHAGTTNASFTVTLSAAASSTVTVSYATANGTATAPSDYVATSGALSFAPGETSKTILVPVVGDGVAEPTETFTVTLSGPVNATLGKAAAAATIVDDEASPVQIDVWRDEHQSPVLTTTTDGGALIDTDNQWTEFLFPARGYPGVFASTSETPPLMRFHGAAPNGTYQVVANLYWNGNFRYQWGYSAATPTQFSVDVTSGPISGEFASYPLGQVVVSNGEFELFTQGAQPLPGGSGYSFYGWASIQLIPVSTPALTVEGPTVAEGQSGTTTAGFTVALSGASTETVTVDYTTVDGTALAASDYLAASGVLTFAPGQTTQVVPVSVLGDTLDEDGESFVLRLSNPSGATIGVSEAAAVITNDDTAPGLSIDDASVNEGDTATSLTFTVTLSAASGRPIAVQYASGNATAIAGADYTASSGALTFNPGETVKTIAVPVTGDLADEPDETFSMQLSSPTNATLIRAAGLATIVDNDPAPGLSLSGASASESGPLTFTATLSAASGRTITVNYATTAGGSATSGTDYTPTSGTLTFAPGETTRTFTVSVQNDALDELDETVNATLSSPSNATLAQATATGVIVDDDATPALSINSVSTAENVSPLTFTVTLSAVSSLPVTVSYATSSGTATSGTDFAAASGTLTFNPGQTTRTLTVAVTNDSLDEDNETLTVTLSAPGNAVITPGGGIGTITDNDASPNLSINSVSVGEAAGTATLTVSLSTASGRNVTVNYATGTSGTATADSDFAATTGALTFTPGQTTRTIVVPITNDLLDEPNETFTVSLSGAQNAGITQASGVVTITDDDATPSLSIAAASADEGAGTMTFTVTLSAASGRTVSVNYGTTAGTAATGTDFGNTSGSLTFTSGQVTRTFTVPIVNDVLDEIDETFTATLSNASNASVSQASAAGTILDNDPSPSLVINDVTDGENTGPATFTVTLSTVSGRTVAVNYATATGTAGTSDFTMTSGTLTFNPGQTSRTFTVTLNNDSLDEDNETFTATLSNPSGATITRATGVATITDNDSSPNFSIGNAFVFEGNSGTQQMSFTVTLSAVSGRQTTVNYATANGSAQAGSDYIATSGTLVFAPGETSKTIVVLIIGDTVNEATIESFTVGLSGAVNAGISDNSGAGTIIDNE